MNITAAAAAPHVVVLSQEYTPSPLIDRTIAAILIFCLILGTTGNFLALRYFVSNENKKLASQLYILISVTDLCTCIAHAPVTFSLLDHRRPGAFSSEAFCCFWTILFEYLQVTSIFLVMLMSVTRALAIRIPFYQINRGALIWVYLAFALSLALESGVRHAFGVYYMYIVDIAYSVKGSSNQSWSLFSNVFNTVNVGLPSIIIFFSFFLSANKLFNQRVTPSNELAHRASVTIAIFTAVFLVCNVPFLGNTILFIIAREVYSYPGRIFSSRFMYSYSWVVSKVLFVVVNAALNPIVYFLRMSGFSYWTRNSAGSEDGPNASGKSSKPRRQSEGGRGSKDRRSERKVERFEVEVGEPGKCAPSRDFGECCGMLRRKDCEIQNSK
ncbi:hypothetical protein ACHWQZ_G009584 [Mnemiopsis leidyi]